MGFIKNMLAYRIRLIYFLFLLILVACSNSLKSSSVVYQECKYLNCRYTESECGETYSFSNKINLTRIGDILNQVYQFNIDSSELIYHGKIENSINIYKLNFIDKSLFFYVEDKLGLLLIIYHDYELFYEIKLIEENSENTREIRKMVMICRHNYFINIVNPPEKPEIVGRATS